MSRVGGVEGDNRKGETVVREGTSYPGTVVGEREKGRRKGWASDGAECSSGLNYFCERLEVDQRGARRRAKAKCD